MKPEIKLVDFNKQKPNLQSKGFDATGVPNGRIVVTAKTTKKNGWTPVDNWSWECSWVNFKLGSHEEHNETWGDEKEHRKLGGVFYLGYDNVEFDFKLSRKFKNKDGIKTFEWQFKWDNIFNFVEIEDEDPEEIVEPEPTPELPKPEPIIIEEEEKKTIKEKFILLIKKHKWFILSYVIVFILGIII